MLELFRRHRRLAAALVLATAAALGCDGAGGEQEPPVSASGAISVVAVGDIADCSDDECPAASTAELASSYRPEVVLALGDLQYPSGALTDFQAEYDQTWGALRDVTMPVPGNHEYYTEGAAGYYAYFGATARPGSNGYYSYDVGGWHLVALNTNNECGYVACDDGSDQQQWFADDLAASDARCTLAYWHHPRWSTGEHLDTEASNALWRTAAAGDVDLVLNGHDHDFERFAPQDGLGQADPDGVTEMVVGTGGGERRSFKVPASPLTKFRVAQQFGVLRLLLAPGSYRSEFVAVGGEVLDSGRAGCG